LVEPIISQRELCGGVGWLTPIMAAIVHHVGSIFVVPASASLAIFPEGKKVLES
jgi:hypothetical protein